MRINHIYDKKFICNCNKAEFGKIKATIEKLNKFKKYQVTIIVTGMHMISKYGNTYLEVKIFPKKKNLFSNQEKGQTQDIILSNTIKKISPILKDFS